VSGAAYFSFNHQPKTLILSLLAIAFSYSKPQLLKQMPYKALNPILHFFTRISAQRHDGFA